MYCVCNSVYLYCCSVYYSVLVYIVYVLVCIVYGICVIGVYCTVLYVMYIQLDKMSDIEL